MSTLSSQRIWLVGSMGSGKTAVGAALAALLGWPLIDNDHELLAHEGRPLLQLSEDGPAELHRHESDQLRRAAVLPPPFVAGVAASVADRPADQELLRSTGSVVYLRATAETLGERVSRDGDRPWVGSDPTDWLRESLARREPAYLQVADVVVDVDDGSPEQVARRVLAGLVSHLETPERLSAREDG